MTVNIKKSVILEVRHNKLIRQIKIFIIFLSTTNQIHVHKRNSCYFSKPNPTHTGYL